MARQFSDKVSEILSFSREEATRLASHSVGPEHLLMGILRDRDGIVVEMLEKMNVNIPQMKAELESKVREDEIGRPVNTRELVSPKNY